MDLNDVIFQFFPDALIRSVFPFGNGHIHTTYKVILKNKPQEYILQKINNGVFKNPKVLIENHLKIQRTIEFNSLEIPQLINYNEDQYLYYDSLKNPWRMMNFIKDSKSLEIVQNETQAFEAGRAFGWFLNSCSSIDVNNFSESIEDFHKLSFRIRQLKEAIHIDKLHRYNSIKNVISFYKEREDSLLQIQQLIDHNQIAKRIVHNDTKINNLLFRKGKAIAVIDMDTVGPGTVFFDYGDALRTICNSAAEDEKILEKVHFNITAFEWFTKGYLQQTKSILNETEKELLFIAPVYMTFIIGIRFLTDYLNGDIYFKTAYAEHNLIRSKVQQKLIEQMEMQIDKLKYIIQKYL